MTSLQPERRSRRPQPVRCQALGRVVLALLLAACVAWVPTARVSACSCVPSTLPEMVGLADLAFVGTAVQSADAGLDPELTIPLVRHTFDVERASVDVGQRIHLLAWGGGGSSCGITFNPDEQWLVLAGRRNGVLETTLCSGNVLVDSLTPAQQADLPDLLPFEPEPLPTASTDPIGSPGPPAEDGDPPPAAVRTDGPIATTVAIALGAAVVVTLLVIVGWRALRRSRS